MRLWMIGVVVGIITVSFLPVLFPYSLVPLLLFFLVILSYFRCPKVFLFWGAFLGLVIGTVYGNSILSSRLSSQCEAIPVSLEGEVISLPKRSRTRDGRLRQRFEFRPNRIEPGFCEGPRRLLLSYYGPQTLRPGEHWQFSARLKKPWGLANTGSFNMQSWYAQSGIDGTGNVREKQAALIQARSDSRLNYHAIRQDVGERLGQIQLSREARGILQALTVADRSRIDGRLWTLLQFYGINHLLVISGLHISITAGAGYLIGGLLARLVSLAGAVRLAGLLPAVLALGFAFSYAALAGFALATVRALCMLACFVVASLWSRGSLSSNNLLIAAVVVLLFNPLAAVGSGFWLSFFSVACLLWLSAWRSGVKLTVRILQTHVYMALAMVPLGGWWFGGVSQVAVLANLVLVPVVGFFVVPVALLAVLSHLAGIAIDHYLWAIAAWPLEQLLPSALYLAEHQQASLYTYLAPSEAEVLLALLALALLLVPMPAGLRVLVPVLALPIFLSGGPPTGASGSATRLTILDVGQGTAVVLQNGDSALVYDTGGGDPEGSNMASMVILPYLRAQGIKRLHTLVISHPDNDHSAGARTLINAMPVEQIIAGGDSLVLPGGRRCRAGEAWAWPSGVRFQVLSPEGSGELSSNNSSCVLQVQLGEFRLLLPGDIDARREKELFRYWRQALRSDVLLPAHHGSLNSSSHTWLKTVQPGYAIFTSGYRNQFGHPHVKISERFVTRGSHVFTTARDGAIELVFEPDGSLTTTTCRERPNPYWM